MALTIDLIKEIFDKHDGEYLEFDCVQNKRSNRPDLHAFMLLDSIFPESSEDMVCGATDDKIWLDCEIEQLEACLTEELIIELTRCGVHYDNENEGLCMFA